MGLQDYRKKRDFASTPEPRGQGGNGPPGRLYVIHKHAASRLHYDLRLEMDGVLKSWAVPRGPSLDPAEKRLAVQVEDHPLEYGAFEGTIPKGEYGGGAVMLWDRGTWEPEGDPAGEFPRGKLSFRLHGEKLRGSWALAQMKDKDGRPSKNWLLLKHKDGEAVAEERYRVVEAAPLSVASRRTLEEIAAGAPIRPAVADELGRLPDPGHLPGARPAPMPETFSPQLATLVAQPPAGGNWLHEIKFDGYRILATIAAGRVSLRTRNGKEWTSRFPAVAEVLGALPVRQAILDGEIVVLRPDGTSDFQALQEFLGEGRPARPIYYLFDLPYCNGYDLTASPLLELKKLMQAILGASPGSGTLRFSDHLQGGGPEVHRQACGLAAEGVVSKRADSAYEQKRSRNWLKSKCRQRQEFVVGGWTEPTGSRSGFGALLLGYYQAGELIFAGRVGSGFTVKDLGRLSARLRRSEQDAAPFRRPPAAEGPKGVHWVRPELIVEVEFREWTREMLLRQAAFKGLREDKEAGEIVREAPPAKPVPPTRTAAEAVVAGVRVTHPDKLLYPEQGVSKLDLANFYAAIGDFILPHLLHRPLTLVRCPDGQPGECFYQKHLKEATPATLRTIPIREKETTSAYPVVDDLPGLIALAQLGVLEIHPWGSRESDLERPDLLTFDLDPGPALAWPKVIEGAHLLRERLAELGLTAFLKTSGGKGLHLVVPLAPRAGWEEAKAFTRAVALDLVRRHPDRFTAESKKLKRTGKIFIDYLRNGRGATTVAAYSTRARANAPVSTPIGWEELDLTMAPDRYRIDNLPQRLAGLKSDPWAGFFQMRQGLTPAWPTALEP